MYLFKSISSIYHHLKTKWAFYYISILKLEVLFESDNKLSVLTVAQKSALLKF